MMFHATNFPADELYLETIAVHPRARDRGVGGALLRFADDEARRRGRRSVSLYCISSNHRAHALYERVATRTRAGRTSGGVRGPWASASPTRCASGCRRNDLTGT